MARRALDSLQYLQRKTPSGWAIFMTGHFFEGSGQSASRISIASRFLNNLNENIGLEYPYGYWLDVLIK